MTNWKPAVLTASAPSGEMTTWINPSAIEQLQREVDALKAKAAPTPVEDEVTDAMVQEGESKAFEYAANMATERQKVRAIYVAMQAARPRKGKAQKPIVDREAVAKAIYKVRGFDWDIAIRAPELDERLLAEADAAIAAMGAKPSAELAALRARCERLRDYALAAYAYVELLERGHTERIPGTMAKTSRWVSEAHDRLQPGDLADLDAAEETCPAEREDVPWLVHNAAAFQAEFARSKNKILQEQNDTLRARCERLARVARASHKLVGSTFWPTGDYEAYFAAFHALHPGDTEAG